MPPSLVAMKGMVGVIIERGDPHARICESAMGFA